MGTGQVEIEERRLRWEQWDQAGIGGDKEFQRRPTAGEGFGLGKEVSFPHPIPHSLLRIARREWQEEKERVLGNRQVGQDPSWSKVVGEEVPGKEEGEGLAMGKGVVLEEKLGERAGASGRETVRGKEKWHKDGGCQVGQTLGREEEYKWDRERMWEVGPGIGGQDEGIVGLSDPRQGGEEGWHAMTLGGPGRD